MVFLERLYYFLRDLSSKPDERGESSAGYLHDKIRKAALGLTKGSLGRLLEVGCGEGLYLAQLSRVNPGIEAYGVDRGPQILARARERFLKDGVTGIKLIEAEAGHLPFEDAYFETVVFVNVLICVGLMEQAHSVLKDIARVCRPKGRLIIEFRNKRSILLRLKYRLARFYDATTLTHSLSTHDENDIRSMLAELGFEIIKKQCVGFLSLSIILEARKYV